MYQRKPKNEKKKKESKGGYRVEVVQVLTQNLPL